MVCDQTPSLLRDRVWKEMRTARLDSVHASQTRPSIVNFLIQLIDSSSVLVHGTKRVHYSKIRR